MSKSFPNPKTIHTFCIPPNCSGVQKFRLNIQDPTLNDIFTTLVDNRRDDQGNHIKPAHRADKFVDNNSLDPKLPEVVSCDISCLDTIEICIPTPEDEVFGIVQNNNTQFELRTVIFPGITAQEQFILLMNYLSNPFFEYSGAFPTTDRFFIYMIFDDKLPVNWGELLDMGNWIRDTSVPLRFPLSFECVTFALYSQNNDKFYEFFKMFLP